MPTTLTREAILEAARRALARYGPRKTSLADIAEPLGVSKPALYYHFPGGKREILEAVLEAEGEAVLEAMRAAVAAEDDPRRQLRAAVLAKVRHVRGRREVLELGEGVTRELRALWETHEWRFKQGERRLLAEILARGQETGVFRAAPRERLARAIQSGLADLVAGCLEEPGRDPEAAVDEMLDVLFYGIVRREAEAGP